MHASYYKIMTITSTMNAWVCANRTVPSELFDKLNAAAITGMLREH